MIKVYFKYVILLIILTLLQVFVFNKFQVSGYINPYIYIYLILILPLSTPGWLLLAVGMISGFSVDMFANTIGIHASAALFLAFVRPYVLVSISPREGFDSTSVPSASEFGMIWFLKYTIIMVLIHHLALFMIEVWSFSHFISTLLRWVVSSFFSILIIPVIELFNYNKKLG